MIYPISNWETLERHGDMVKNGSVYMNGRALLLCHQPLGPLRKISASGFQ